MLTLFGNLDSGNVHKVQMILHARAIPFRRVDVRQDRGQPRDPRFLALNPMGKVPALRFADGDVLSDSGAVLFYFAEGTALWPGDRRCQAEVLRWMFFEQYSHEPALAVLRYLIRFAPDSPGHSVRIDELRPLAVFVLGVLDKQLRSQDWIAGTRATIADIALYPYTRFAVEIGLDPRAWPALARWLERVESMPRHLPVYSDAATETITFETYFGAAT
jgi:glutathione S-transferase